MEKKNEIIVVQNIIDDYLSDIKKILQVQLVKFSSEKLNYLNDEMERRSNEFCIAMSKKYESNEINKTTNIELYNINIDEYKKEVEFFFNRLELILDDFRNSLNKLVKL